VEYLCLTKVRNKCRNEGAGGGGGGGEVLKSPLMWRPERCREK